MLAATIGANRTLLSVSVAASGRPIRTLDSAHAEPALQSALLTGRRGEWGTYSRVSGVRRSGRPGVRVGARGVRAGTWGFPAVRGTWCQVRRTRYAQRAGLSPSGHSRGQTPFSASSADPSARGARRIGRTRYHVPRTWCEVRHAIPGYSCQRLALHASGLRGPPDPRTPEIRQSRAPRPGRVRWSGGRGSG